MPVELIRRHCKSFPHATESVQWGSDLVFKIGGKMFAVAPLEPAPVFVSFKCSPEAFADLTERPGIIPAPYLARALWVALQSEEAMAGAELKQLLRQSYELVLSKLAKKTQADLRGGSK